MPKSELDNRQPAPTWQQRGLRFVDRMMTGGYAWKAQNMAGIATMPQNRVL